MNMHAEIEAAIGQKVTDMAPLSGGCVGQVYRLRRGDGLIMVAKVDERPSPRLHLEGQMLTYLNSHSQLPVPSVYYSSARLLLMEFLPGDSYFNDRAQDHAAELLAELHNITGPHFGLEWDTLIGGLSQPNSPKVYWLEFFREQRLLHMAEEGVRAGRLPLSTLARLRRFCDCLDEWLLEPERPSLIHGDVWTTNVLAAGDQITGFIDPAIYYADPEIELAFTTLFGTFGRPFFERYQAIRPIRPGFFEERCHIYNLYPLLVHVRLFGGSYVQSVNRTLQHFGF